MIIGIDARPLIEKKSGIGIYLKNILDGILQFDHENRYLLLSDSKIYYETTRNNVDFIIYPKTKFIPNTFFYEYRLGHYLKKRKIHLDVFWGTQQLMPFDLGENCYKVLTIHDLAYKLYPETVNKKIRLMLNLFSKKSLEMADSIIAVSNYTSQKLKELYPEVMCEKIHVVYESGNINTVGENHTSPKSSKFFLFIGNIEPRKNIEVLLNAFEKIKGQNQEVELYICGKYGWDSAEIMDRMNSMDGVKYLNYVSDDKKTELLMSCMAFVMPSKYEGFGIPVVEALQSNKIAIVADNSSLSEIISNDELRFKTDDFVSLAKIMDRLINDKAFNTKCIEYCTKRGKDFLWEKCAEETYSLLLHK